MKKITFNDSFQNQTRKTRWLGGLSVLLMLFVGQLVFAQEYQHLQITNGLTQDVIANGVGAANLSTTSGVDVVNFAFVSNDYQATASSPALTFGLPVTGLITSAVTATPNLTFQLASYAANNSLKLEALNSTATLTFSNAVAAKKLLFLVTSGSGISTFTGVITFTDNSTQSISSSTVPDWFNSTTLPVAISGIGRINTTNNTTENPAGNPRMYQLEVPILVANQTKIISSIQITKTSLAGNALNIFAVTAELLGACPSPDALSASATTTSATVSWTIPAIVPAGGYQYYYATNNTPPTGSTTPSGTLVSSATSVALTNLLPTQNYFFWIRSDCGNDTYGAWQFASFTTATPGHIGGNSTATNTNFPINSCYGYNYSQQIYLASELQAVLEPGNTYITEIRFKPTTLPTTPANFTNWTVYMGNTTQATFSSNTNWIPDLTQVYTGNLTFTANGWVSIVLNTGFIWDGTSNLVIGVDENTPGFSCTANWASFPSGSNRGILFYSDTINPDPASPPTANIAPNANIAQIQIQSIPIPTCFPPTSLVISNVTFNSADLDWTPYGTETAWQYVVGASTVTSPESLTPVSVTGAPEASITTGLNPNTTYKVWIRTNCGTEFSYWSGPFTFKTLCDDETDFEEHFDTTTTGGTNMPDCWGRLVVGTPTVNVGTGSTSPMSPSNRLVLSVNSTTTPAQEGYAVLRPVSNLSAGTHRLRFKAFATAAGRVLEVGYLTDPSNLATFMFLTDIQLPSTTVASTQQFIVVPSNVPEGVKHLAIKNPGFPGGSSLVYIDDVYWEPIPTTVPACATNVVATPNASCGNFATSITWNVVPGADGYKLKLGTTPGGTEVFGNENLGIVTSYSFTGNFNTTYYYTIIPYNAFGDATGCTELSFTTAVNGCYCTSLPTSNDGLGITNVLLDTTNFPTGDVTYFNHTATTVTLTQAVNTNLQITFATGYTYNTYVWIDFNDNFIFDSSELVFTGESTNVNPSVFNASFVMPATATLGTHRMRIVTADTLPTPNPCYSGAFGVTLDFSVNIIPAPSCIPPVNLTATGITSSSANLGWTESGTATVWDIEWGTAGFTPTGTPNIVGTTTNPQNLTGLLSNTAYSFYVRANCGGTAGLSNWTGPFSFFTACEATNVPYVMDFETAVVPALPNCTSVQNVGTGNLWTVANNPGNGFTTKTLQYLYNSANAANVWFFTQGLNLTAGTTYTIAFDYGSNSTFFVEKLKVAYGTSANAASMTNVVVDLPNIVNNAPLNSSTEFTPTTTGVYYFGFNAYSIANQFNLYVDNINIQLSLSTGDFDTTNFKVYPNPVTDILTVSYSNEISEVVVYNLLGQQVVSAKPNATQSQVDLSGLTAGTYLVKVTSDEVTKTVKVVKN